MVRRHQLGLLLLLVACGEPRDGEDAASWFDQGDLLDVTEPVSFTEENYAFPTDDADGIAFLKDNVLIPTESNEPPQAALWGQQEAASAPGGCDIEAVPELPFEIDGVVTAHPRFYFKTSGCHQNSDEKYYGSFFIQDRTGGLFVLGDSKVAHFDMGDRIRISARALRSGFGLDLIYSYDLLEVVEHDLPIYYEHPTDTFEQMQCIVEDDRNCDGSIDEDEGEGEDALPHHESPIGQVYRVTGEIVVAPDTFGEFTIEDEQGRRFVVGLDMELNRRGIELPVGMRITATGPVLYSFSTYKIVIMRKGQITVED